MDTASASKRRHNGRTGLDVGRVLSANICKMLWDWSLADRVGLDKQTWGSMSRPKLLEKRNKREQSSGRPDRKGHGKEGAAGKERKGGVHRTRQEEDDVKSQQSTQPCFCLHRHATFHQWAEPPPSQWRQVVSLSKSSTSSVRSPTQILPQGNRVS